MNTSFRPSLRARLALALLPIPFAGGLAGCGGGDGAPRYTLQAVMFEVEVHKGKLDQALMSPGGAERAAEHGATMLRWLKDPAAERYLERTDLKGTREQFMTHQAALETTLADLLQTAQTDPAGAAQRIPELDASCNACHAIFRPDLKPR